VTRPAGGFAPVGEVIDAIGRGEIVVVVDDEDRENEGDLVVAADLVTPEIVNFMVTHGRGLVCLSLDGGQLDHLGIGAMDPQAGIHAETHFGVSIDLDVPGVSGISAFERAATIRHAVDPLAQAEDFRRPGHVFTLRATPGGVLVRAGHTEASADLARLAGRTAAGVICEVMNDDGTMMRLDDLRRFADRFGLLITSIADLIAYRRKSESLIRRVAVTRLPSDHGEWEIYGYESVVDGVQSVALVRGDPASQPAALVRMHSECLTGDVFASRRCDCGAQLHTAMDMIDAAGHGAVIYLRGHEGRGIGLSHKLQAYQLQDAGYDTVDANLALGLPADARDYGVGAAILRDLGLRRLRLLTNNPAKRAGLDGFGLEVVERVPLVAESRPERAVYLATKVARMGHDLTA